jgi:hypothetical protein
MTTISGFTFGHNLIAGGYPFVEAINAIRSYVDNIYVVDMQSTDGTREVLEQLDVNIINGFWGNQAGETLKQAHAMHIYCDGDIVWHFEADEVYDNRLCEVIDYQIRRGYSDNLKVYRLQVEQNFQRIRWYPEPLHRIFPNHSGIIKAGQTTNNHDMSDTLGVEHGYLWDCTNCFRDNWFNRVNQQAELRNSKPQYLMAGVHMLNKVEFSEEEVKRFLTWPHWTWRHTPLDIPDILKPLVGMTKYEPIL